jgi:hypothetical protein
LRRRLPAEAIHLGGQAVGVEIGLGDEHGTSDIGQGATVRGLVVFGGQRPGHQDRWSTGGGQLGDGRGAGSGHHQVSGGIGEVHAVLEGYRVVDEAPGRVARLPRAVVVAGAEDVMDGKVASIVMTGGEGAGDDVERP